MCVTQPFRGCGVRRKMLRHLHRHLARRWVRAKTTPGMDEGHPPHIRIKVSHGDTGTLALLRTYRGFVVHKYVREDDGFVESSHQTFSVFTMRFNPPARLGAHPHPAGLDDKSGMVVSVHK